MLMCWLSGCCQHRLVAQRIEAVLRFLLCDALRFTSFIVFVYCDASERQGYLILAFARGF